MSNDDFAPPPPQDGSESGLGGLAGEPTSGAADATPSNGASSDPTQAIPSDEAPTPGDPTQVMPTAPVTPPSNPVQSGAGIPPIVPGAAGVAGVAAVAGDEVPLEEEFPEEPWYKQPKVIAGALAGLVILGLIALLLLLGDDDDGSLGELSTDPVALIVLRSDSGGAPVATSLGLTVIAQGAAPEDFTWITPSVVAPGEAAVLETDATGRVEFRWSPTGGNEDGTWSTTIEVAEAVPPEGTTPVAGIGAECELQRGGSTEALVVSTDVQVDQTVESAVGVGRYGFPNVVFRAGDRITCSMINQLGTPPPTTIPETTTTVAQTTTVAPTTAAPTTAAPTTAAPTTAAPTTAAPTTAAPTTVAPPVTDPPTSDPPTTDPPPTGPTLTEFLQNEDDLAVFGGALQAAGILAEIENSAVPYTIFIPIDSGIDITSVDLTDPNVLRAHLSFEGAFDLDGLAQLDPKEIGVEAGNPQPVDAGATPPTVGDGARAEIIRRDNAVELGYVQVIDAVLEVQS